ncbi:FAD-binding oxidoreductase [Ruegeria sp. 2012CJ41-6]|uniref:FAD-binding oxidoreductase n=1 Tax=Ruegeria spongiae TaxID=2942209 RepID=A0ABT0Q526_9RHOB|nr:FAD-binding oxidoreductase [Ruegeria spongiae]MCL6284014.1 FAD-binding oxidoreductase [Ruegeria spongiae]
MKGIPITGASPVEHDAALPSSAPVVIIGGGIIGVMTAYFLAQKGLRPVLLEKGRIAGEQSARNWGWVRQMGRDPAELPIMVEANRIWHQLQAELAEDLGLRPCGLTYVARSDKELAGFEAWLPHARENGVDTRMLNGAELADLVPQAQGRWPGAMHTPSDMRAEPWAAVPALARAAVAAGAVIRENCAARLLDVEAGRIAGVVSEAGRIATRDVVMAGGAWSNLFLRRHGIDIPQLSVRATVVATTPVPDIHAGGADFGAIALRRRVDGGYSLAEGDAHDFWIGPDAFRAARAFWPQLRADPFGRRYLPYAPRNYPDAWGTKRRWAGDETSPFEQCRVLNPAPNHRKIGQILERFRQLFPSLGTVQAAAAWAGMIDTMPDVVPVVDRAGGLPGLSICTGMSGHGFGIGPAFGRIMADLVTGDAPGHDLSRFRLSRFRDGSALVPGPAL